MAMTRAAWLVILVLFVVLLACVVLGSEDAPEVKINQGVLRGKYLRSRNGRRLSAFTGIPFAKPPLGILRFKAPVPAEPWEGTLDASKDHAICPQTNPFKGDFTVQGTEDCLYLNVYTPQLSASNKHPLPVIFFIHGGAFVFGSGGYLWYGPELLLDKDVVLVIPNYRLGALGFLSTGDEVLPGNNGLKDQNLALKWTKDNIFAFGGDPDSITIVGHSSGAACSHYHVLSPLSRGLIKGAIAQSGTAIAAWAIASKEEAARNTKRLAEILNCPTSSSRQIIDCLRGFDASDIVNQDIKFVEWALDPAIPFKPVIEPDIEGSFISQHPIDIIKSGKPANVPFMTGITTDEGALKSSGYYSNPSWIEDFNKDFNRVVPISLQYTTNPHKDKMSKKIREFYFGDRDIDNTTKSELTDMYRDVIFLIGADGTVRLYSKHSSQPVYYYLFGYRGTESHSKFFGDAGHNYGVCHADELLYLFTMTALFPSYKPSESDQKMTEILTTLWANFAKTGNPTPETNALISTKWEPVQSENLEYYFIKNPLDIKMDRGLYTERARFWRELTDAYDDKYQARNEL